MGLFDKLFKRKKSVPKGSRTAKGTKTGSTAPAGRPIKGPPSGKANVYQTSQTHQIRSSPYYQSGQSQSQSRSSVQGELDEESRRILERSLAKIPKSGAGSSGTPSAGQARSSRPSRAPASQQNVSAPSGGLSDSGFDAKKTLKQPTAGKVASSKKPGVDDMKGEEELFRKLIQMDKELQQKLVTKTPAGEVPQKAKPVEKTKLTPAQELKKKERELRKFEAKLKEKEKKLKERENLNQTFSQLQDVELEQFGSVNSSGASAVEGGGDIDVSQAGGELEAGEVIEPEDHLQPLKNLNFNNFIVGPSNRFAHDVALSVAKAPADAYNPLFIYSEVGLGKTHLLCAIGNYIKSKNPKANTVYISSEKFTNELLDYLRLGEMEKFRLKYRNIDVLLIDDIQFIGGQEGTQEEFFHTFNSLYNAHKQIVITSDRPPKNIAHLKDRLRSRFEGGLIVNIKLPDLGTRTMILHEKAEKDGIYIPDEIINYIAAKVKSNVRTLIGVLNRIVAHSSLSDRELDKSLVDDVLRDVVDEGIDITGV
jgi:chromosomal replication initiator protein DnaA